MIKIYTDGASRGNPGNTASAFVVVENGKPIYSAGYALGKGTNNEAEYTAVIMALRYALHYGIRELVIVSDSNVVTEQIKGNYKVKAKNLIPLLNEVLSLVKRLNRFDIVNVKRNAEYIPLADKICNDVLDLIEKRNETLDVTQVNLPNLMDR